MQVQIIQSNNYQHYGSPAFGTLKVSENAQKMINSRYDSSVSQMIGTWKKELDSTKHWNLNIFEICDQLWMAIESKNSYSKSDCEAPLSVSVKPESNTFYVYGRCIGGGGYVWYRPEFPSHKDAENAYNTLKKYQDMQDTDKDIDTVDKIAWAVDSVKILEQAYENMINPKKENPESEIKKLPLSIRIKNAFQALKG